MLKRLVENGCELCPRRCGVDRNKYKGLCKTKNELEIASYNLHFGEEPPISGKRGSGTIFFAGCNLSCIYCQNYPISQLKSAYKTISVRELADIMIKLQKRGAHNINLVTPSHFIHLICQSIAIAKTIGLNIPVVYNTSSYDSAEVIEYIKDYVDIYLADLKYSDDNLAKELSGVSDYFDAAARALLSMYKTKGELKIKNGIAARGLIIRHLVLPNHINNTKNVLSWIFDNMPNAYISLMFQYFPAYKAFDNKKLNRKLTYEEYERVMEFVDKFGNVKGFIQEYE